MRRDEDWVVNEREHGSTLKEDDGVRFLEKKGKDLRLVHGADLLCSNFHVSGPLPLLFVTNKETA